MSWKNLPYWLKGGIITITIYIIVIVISILTTGIDCSGECLPIYFILSVPALFPLLFIVQLLNFNLETILLQFGLNFSSNPSIKFFIIVFIWSILFYFFIGSIVGWIIEKIKSRKIK